MTRSLSARSNSDGMGRPAGPNTHPGDLNDPWFVSYDGGNMEDLYDGKPSEFEIRQIQRAAPDEPVRIGQIDKATFRRTDREVRPPLASS